MMDLLQNEITRVEMKKVLGGDEIIIPPIVVPGTTFPCVAGAAGAAGHILRGGQITEIME